MIPIKTLQGTKAFMEKFTETFFVAHHATIGNSVGHHDRESLERLIRLSEIKPTAIFKITRYKKF